MLFVVSRTPNNASKFFTIIFRELIYYFLTLYFQIESWDWVTQLQKDGFPQKTEAGNINFFRDDGESNVGKNLPTEKGEDNLKGALSSVASAVKGGDDGDDDSSDDESSSEE